MMRTAHGTGASCPTASVSRRRQTSSSAASQIKIGNDVTTAWAWKWIGGGYPRCVHGGALIGYKSDMFYLPERRGGRDPD